MLRSNDKELKIANCKLKIANLLATKFSICNVVELMSGTSHSIGRVKLNILEAVLSGFTI